MARPGIDSQNNFRQGRALEVWLDKIEACVALGNFPATAKRFTMDQSIITTGAGPGITDAADARLKTSVTKIGEIFTTTIYIDMQGLESATSDLDIIGEAASGDDASLCQITAANNGAIVGGVMTCLELPAGASITLDIDLYSATVSTGEHEDIITGLSQTALLTKGGNWAAGDATPLSGVPPANDFLYLTNGATDTAATYTAGKFLIQLWGI